MPLENLNCVLEKAYKERYAVGAFDTWNIESLRTVIEAAEESRSPVIVQAYTERIKHTDIEYYSSIGKVAAENAKIPVVLHLDHGDNLRIVMQSIRQGFTSVGVENPGFTYQQYVDFTRRVVEVAHAVDVSVEAELGEVPRVREGVTDASREIMTNPEEASRFVAETDIDALAISIGTVSGLYKGMKETKIDFDRLRRIRNLVNVPLVLHGGTALTSADIEKLIELGVCKINIGTALHLPFINGVKRLLENSPENIDLYKIHEVDDVVQEEAKGVIITLTKLYGCSGKASTKIYGTVKRTTKTKKV